MNKLPIEDKLSVSAIRFRSERGIEELVKVKEKKDYNQSALGNAQSIVDYFYTILDKNRSIPISAPPIYFKLLLDGISEERIEGVKNTKLTLEKIAKKEEVCSDEVDEGINFFSELSYKCTEYLGSSCPF
jgi:hypothetical protein